MAFHNVPPNGFPDLPDVEELEAVEKDVTTLKTTTAEQGAAITALGTAKVAKADIAPTFSAESNYAVGDLVYYEGVLYECTTAHEAAAWNAEDFTATSIDEELSAINSNISTLESGLTNAIKYYNLAASQSITLNHGNFLLFALRLNQSSGNNVNAIYFENNLMYNGGDNANPLSVSYSGGVYTVTNNNATAINLIVIMPS